MAKQSKTWCFTLNNYTELDEKFFRDLDKTYLSYGRELAPDTGTPHMQGYIIFRRNYSLIQLKKLHDKCHWEQSKCSDAMNYTFKDQNYYLEDNRKQGSRTDLKEVANVIKEQGIKTVKDNYPEMYIRYHSGMEKLVQHYTAQRDFKPYVTWIYGPTGTGKTRTVFELEPDLWISGKNLKWWDGYENQKATLFDDFRKDFCTFHELLRILDRYPYTVEVKGGHRILNSPRMYITSCYSPQETYETREDIEQLIRRIDKIYFLDKDKCLVEKKLIDEDTKSECTDEDVVFLQQ